MTKKLSPKQSELLRSIEDEPKTCAASYRPAQRLVEFGLAQWVTGRFSDLLAITAAGYDWLNPESDDVR